MLTKPVELLWILLPLPLSEAITPGLDSVLNAEDFPPQRMLTDSARPKAISDNTPSSPPDLAVEK